MRTNSGMENTVLLTALSALLVVIKRASFVSEFLLLLIAEQFHVEQMVSYKTAERTYSDWMREPRNAS